MILAKKRHIRNIGGGGDPFTITINTALGTGTTFTLPLPSGYSYDFWWTPYVGATPLHVTAYNDANATYDYGIHGTYQARVGVNTGDKCGGWSFNGVGDKDKLISIDSWGNPQFDYIQNGFRFCLNLASLPATGSIGGTSSVTSCNSLFRGCDLSSTSFSQGIFDLLTGCTNFSFLCYNGNLGGKLPDELFRYNTLATNFAYAFAGCNLNEIGEDIFYYNTSATSYNNCFSNHPTMILPTRMFNLASMANANFSYFMTSSDTADSVTGTIQPVWDYITNSHVDAFKNQTAITNYIDIPFDWKGLVEVASISNEQLTLYQVGITAGFLNSLESYWADNNYTVATSGVEMTHNYSSIGTYNIKLAGTSKSDLQNLDFSNMPIIGNLDIFALPNLNNITFANSGNGVVTRIFAYNNTGLSTLDLSNVPISGLLYTYASPNLTSIIFANSGNGVLNNVQIHTCNLSTLDFSNVALTGLLYAYNNPNLNNITFANSGNGILGNTILSGCNFNTLDFSNIPLQAVVRVENNPVLSSITFASSGNGGLTDFRANGCSLPNIDFSVFSTSTGVSIQLQDNAMTSTEVDNQIINLDTTSWINGTLNIAGTNASRTSASDTAYNNLVANGWAITVN